MNTLIVAPNWIGDAVMAGPLLALVRRADPGGRIEVLAPRWVAPAFAAMPDVDRVVATDLAHGRLQWSARRAFARQLSGAGPDEATVFDRAFVLPNSFKSALIPWLAGIRERVGYRGEMRFGLLNRRLPDPPAGLPMRARYAALASAVGIDVAPPLPEPRLAVDDATVAAVRERFDLQAAAELVVLCPGAEYGPAKRWPADHFAALGALVLAERPGAHVVVLGGGGDADAGRTVVDGIAPPLRARVHDLTGRTSLADAIALVAASSSIVSNDSGLMHVAAALSRPQVALFGSSDPRHTPPLSTRATAIWLHLDCSPCFARVCPLGHLRCLVDIAPQRVFDTMQNTAPSPAVAR